MPTALSGDLTRHHQQPFYSQPNTPKYFWVGCLGPLAFVALLAVLAMTGLQTNQGLQAIRGYILFLIAYLVLQLVFGGGLFARNRSSFAKGLLIGGATIFLLLILALIGFASVISSFIQ
jgi:hypothetical protein